MAKALLLGLTSLAVADAARVRATSSTTLAPIDRNVFFFDWVRIDGGAPFTLGDSSGNDTSLAQPAVPARVEGFRIAKYPVTNDQYAACTRAGACTPPTFSGTLPTSWTVAQPVDSVAP